MERMKRLQKNFRDQHKGFFEEETPTKTMKPDPNAMDTSASSSAAATEIEGVPMEGVQLSLDAEDEPEVGILPPDAGFPVSLGADRSVALQKALRRVTCILCQEDEVLSFDTGIVCAAYVESTRLFAQQRALDQEEDSERHEFRHFAPSDLHWGNNLSTCAHTMHYACYRSFAMALQQRERLRVRSQAVPGTLDYENNEYQCPLCKRLCNCAMPLLPNVGLLKGVVP